jgi:hypothetical protein
MRKNNNAKYVTIEPFLATLDFTIPQILFPNRLHSGLVPLAGLSQPDQAVQVQRRVVQPSDQMVFDIRPGASAQNRSQLTGLALRVLPLLKSGRFVHRKGLEYARVDV